MSGEKCGSPAMNRTLFSTVVALGLASVAFPAATTRVAARDYIVTGTKPNDLFVVNPATRKVVSDFHIPNAHDYVSIIVPSPHGKVAYVLVNRAESIAGINLRTGREVFRANLSRPGLRVKCMFAFDVTPDGRKLIVYEYPTRLKIDQYVVEPPVFAIFDTAAGLHAKPIKVFPAPRRIEMILASRRGGSFYALGFNLYQYDLATGRLLQRKGILDWHRRDHSSPDMLAFWPVTEPTGVFSSPVYSTFTGPGTPPGGIPVTSLMTLNLRTGALAYHDFGRTTAPIFSTVLSPKRRWAYGAYTKLTKISTRQWKVVRQINLPHTYYSVNISTNGKYVYVGGAMCDIAIFRASTFKPVGDIRLPGCGDQALATLRVIQR